LVRSRKKIKDGGGGIVKRQGLKNGGADGREKNQGIEKERRKQSKYGLINQS